MHLNLASYKFWKGTTTIDKKRQSMTKMGVKIITYPKFINSICLIHFLSNNVKRSQMWAEWYCFLPFKILKASTVCESRLMAIPWFCFHFSVAHGRTHRQRFLWTVLFFSSESVPSQLGKRLGPNFRSTPLSRRHCRHNQNLPNKTCLLSAQAHKPCQWKIVKENLLIIHTSNKDWQVSFQRKIARVDNR